MAMKNKRKRINRETIRKNAQKGNSGPSWYNLPDGVSVWTPEKPGKYFLDFLPYEVTSDHHPDGIDPGCLWYKYPLKIHHGVGVQKESIVCPRSINKKCPICEEREKLIAEKDGWDVHKDIIMSLRPQEYVAFNIIDPNDSEKIALFCLSQGKFYTALKKELDEGEDDILTFFDVTKEGKTLKVRFSEAEFSGRKYLETTRIDFKDREEMDEDEILSKVINLDTFLNVFSYDKIKNLFLSIEDEDEDEDEDEEPKKKKEVTDKKKKIDEDEDEDEDEEPKKKKEVTDKKKKIDEDEDEDEEPKKKKEVTDKKKKNKCPNGHNFGKDIDEYDECDDCPIWNECEEATG